MAVVSNQCFSWEKLGISYGALIKCVWGGYDWVLGCVCVCVNIFSLRETTDWSHKRLGCHYSARVHVTGESRLTAFPNMLFFQATLLSHLLWFIHNSHIHNSLLFCPFQYKCIYFQLWYLCFPIEFTDMLGKWTLSSPYSHPHLRSVLHRRVRIAI